MFAFKSRNSAQRFLTSDLFGLTNLVPNLMRNLEQYNETLSGGSANSLNWANQEETTKKLFQEMVVAKRAMKKGVTERRVGKAEDLYEQKKAEWNLAKKRLAEMQEKMYLPGFQKGQSLAFKEESGIESAVQGVSSRVSETVQTKSLPTQNKVNMPKESFAEVKIQESLETADLPEVNVRIEKVEAEKKQVTLREKLKGFAQTLFKKAEKITKETRTQITNNVGEVDLEATAGLFMPNLRNSKLFKAGAFTALLAMATPALGGTTSLQQSGVKKLRAELSDTLAGLEFGPSVAYGQEQGMSLDQMLQGVTDKNSEAMKDYLCTATDESDEINEVDSITQSDPLKAPSSKEVKKITVVEVGKGEGLYHVAKKLNSKGKGADWKDLLIEKNGAWVSVMDAQIKKDKNGSPIVYVGDKLTFDVSSTEKKEVVTTSVHLIKPTGVKQLYYNFNQAADQKIMSQLEKAINTEYEIKSNYIQKGEQKWMFQQPIQSFTLPQGKQGLSLGNFKIKYPNYPIWIDTRGVKLDNRSLIKANEHAYGLSQTTNDIFQNSTDLLKKIHTELYNDAGGNKDDCDKTEFKGHYFDNQELSDTNNLGVKALMQLLNLDLQNGQKSYVKQLEQELGSKNSAFVKILIQSDVCSTKIKKAYYFVNKNGLDLSNIYSKTLLIAYIQYKNNLNVDGVFGPSTYKVLNELSFQASKPRLGQAIAVQVNACVTPIQTSVCETGDCVPQVEVPQTNNESVDQIMAPLQGQGDIIPETTQAVSDYARNVDDFTKEIGGLSLAEIADNLGVNTLLGDENGKNKQDTFAKGSLLAMQSNLLEKASLHSGHIAAVEKMKQHLYQAVDQKLQTYNPAEMAAKDHYDAERQAYYALQNALLMMQGLSQVEIPSTPWNIYQSNGENIYSSGAAKVSPLIKCTNMVEAKRLNHLAQVADAKWERSFADLEEKGDGMGGTMDRREIIAKFMQTAEYQALVELLESIQAQEAKNYQSLGELHTSLNQGYLVGNNAYDTLPDFMSTNASRTFQVGDLKTVGGWGKIIDSTIFFLPKAWSSIVTMAKNNLAGNGGYNTDAFEAPYLNAQGEIVTDQVNKQRYSDINYTNPEGEKMTVSANRVFDQRTGLGWMGETGLSIDGNEAQLVDKSRLMSYVALFYDAGMKMDQETFLQKMISYVNVDWDEITRSIDPNFSVDRDFETLVKNSFEKSEHGQSLIRLYQGDKECAWKAYVKIVSLILRTNLDQEALDGKVQLNRIVTLGTRVDGMSGILLYELLKEYFKGSDNPKKPQSNEGAETGVSEPYPGDVNTPPETILSPGEDAGIEVPQDVVDVILDGPSTLAPEAAVEAIPAIPEVVIPPVVLDPIPPMGGVAL